MRRDNGIGRRIRRQEGVAAVEFAIIMPVALLIVVGIIQFGVIYSQYQVLQGAAREGARCASVQAGGLTTCDVTTTVQTAARREHPLLLLMLRMKVLVQTGAATASHRPR